MGRASVPLELHSALVVRICFWVGTNGVGRYNGEGSAQL